MEERKNISELLARQVVIGDGAMGTELYAKGVFVNTCFDELNLTKPELIKEVHRSYISAGSDFIETNTFGANQIKLAKFGLADKFEQINTAGVSLAKEVAGQEVLVAAAVGPSGIAFSHTTDNREIISRLSVSFEKQFKFLAAAGADFLLLETFDNASELLLAVKLAQQSCDLPTVAQITVNQNNFTNFGDRLDETIQQLCEFDNVAAVGTNCSLGPAEMLDSLDIIRTVSTKPITVQPNAGMPKTVDGRTLYMCTPEYMAEYAKRFYEKGARIIGACCGSKPEHIKQIVSAVKSIDRAFKPKQCRIEIKPATEYKKFQQPTELRLKSQFASKLAAGQKVLTIEVSPPKGADIKPLLEKVEICKRFGADAVNIPDGPRASSRLSALITAIKIEQSCGIEALLHFCCRDRNLIAMQSDLLGIHTVGLRNVLIITGDPPKLGEFPDATGVFDLDSVALTKVVRNLNCGIDIAGNALETKTELVLGVGANPVASDMPRELARFAQKVSAGAEFAITQPVFDAKSLFDFLDATKACKIPLIAGIWPFTSYKNAEFMANEVPGVVVPESILARMSKATDAKSSKQLGVEIAKELMAEIEPAVAGFAVSAPFGNVRMALAAAGKIDIDDI